MIYLLLAILCGAMMAVVMRLSEGKVQSKLSMLAVNYFTCLVCSWAISGFGNPFPAAEGMARAMALGVINGCFYASSLMINQYNISTSGVILSSVFSKMGGMLVPLLASIALFAEMPTAFQAVGVVLSVAAVIVLNYRGGQAGGAFRLSLFALLLSEGLVCTMPKVYKEWGSAALEGNYLLCTFLVAFSMLALIVLARGERPGMKELVYGFFIGLPNFLCARFVLLALETVPGVVIYPSRSVGTILMVALAGVVLFKERLSRRQMAAVAVILVSLVLLNL